MDYRKAINYIVNRRRDDLAEADSFFKHMLKSDPEFREAELNLRAAELDEVHGSTDTDKVKDLRRIRDGIIEKLGVKDKLNPPPHCSLCGDTGRVNGQLCKCVRTLAVATRSDNIELPLRSFNELNLSLFTSDCARLIGQTASELYTIAEKGVTAKKKNINLIGKTGTGKTFMASCFAGECQLLGRTVVYITAFSFVNRALKYHTGFNEDRTEHLTPLLDTDVLIIDDLGTESMLKNVTCEYLYHVINERQLRGLTTFITSNLSIDEIGVRYGERIASRLFDKKLCYTREFDFGDIRKIKMS